MRRKSSKSSTLDRAESAIRVGPFSSRQFLHPERPPDRPLGRLQPASCGPMTVAVLDAALARTVLPGWTLTASSAIDLSSETDNTPSHHARDPMREGVGSPDGRAGAPAPVCARARQRA